jgi:hypothetical protein
MTTVEIINLAPGIISAYAEIGGRGSSTLHSFVTRNCYNEFFLDGARYGFNSGHSGVPASPATASKKKSESSRQSGYQQCPGWGDRQFCLQAGGTKLPAGAYLAILPRDLQPKVVIYQVRTLL